MPKLSIIVPVYKVEQYIHKCVDSILNQTFTDFELILVDDGSPDNCGAICDEYSLKDERVRVIHKENGGVSKARNFGIDKAKGEYIGFVDSDDYIDANMYQEMLAFLEANDLDVVCTDTYIVRGDRKKYKPRYSKDMIFENGTAITENLNGNLDNAVWNKVYKREVISDIRFPLNRRYEDVATVYKWFFNANKVGYLSKPYYYYIKLDSSFIGTSFNSRSRYEHFLAYQERYEFAKKNGLKVSEECKKLAVKAALSFVTVENAGCGNSSAEEKKVVSDFLLRSGNVKGLDGKSKLLLWSFRNCKLINKVYGKLSYLGKKIK